MANLSDAFGTITVESVGKEFLEFLSVAQGEEPQAYYLLADDLEGVEPDEKGNLTIDFSTAGRWSYENNLDGYLLGEWFQNENDKHRKEAYDKFIDALVKKNGVVAVEYSDSDSAMDWMGTGEFRLFAENGKPQHYHEFDSSPITLKEFAELNGESEYWALEYLYGDEVGEAYARYETKVKQKGETPETPDTWYDTIYDEDEEPENWFAFFETRGHERLGYFDTEEEAVAEANLRFGKEWSVIRGERSEVVNT